KYVGGGLERECACSSGIDSTGPADGAGGGSQADVSTADAVGAEVGVIDGAGSNVELVRTADSAGAVDLEGASAGIQGQVMTADGCTSINCKSAVVGGEADGGIAGGGNGTGDIESAVIGETECL